MRLDRRAKIRLLLATLLDATAPGRGTSDVRAAFSSRPPAKSEELWNEGSYGELWSCLDVMKTRYPKMHRHVLACHVSPEPWGDRRYAEAAIRVLDKRLMPSNVYVPQEISENAGFLPSDAKTATRPRRH